jgi:hypothetical protein
MSPFEDLYGRRCRIPMRWDNPTKIIILGIEILKEIEKKVSNFRPNLM